MGTLIAIEKLNYMKPEPVFICHSRVVDLHPEETAKAKAFNAALDEKTLPGKGMKEYVQEYKEFKCLDCGVTWKESFRAPLIVSAEQMKTYYFKAQPCSLLK